MLRPGTKLHTALTQLQTQFPSLSAERQARALSLLSQLRELRETQQVSFFEPNAAQQRYIDAVGDPESFIVIFAAANGIGKSAATAALIAAIIWPELAPKEIFGSFIYQNWPYPKDFRIISTPQQISEGGSIQRELKRWFPKGQYQAVKNGKPYLSQYLAKDFTVNLMSYDQPPEAFEGATCGLVAFDEPPPKVIFNACGARMRRGGRLIFPGTPLMDAAWIMDDLVAKADGKYIRLVSGDIEDNCANHSAGGMLKHDDIERMIRNYDPDEMEARKSGKFMHLSGRIFKTFDRNVHILKDDPELPKENAAFYMACDPAIGKPCFAVFAWVDPTGTVTVYDEWPEYDFFAAKDCHLTVGEYVELFKGKEHGKQFTRILDRHFGNQRRSMGGVTLREEFAQAGLDFLDSYGGMEAAVEVETGILKVKDYLKYDRNKLVDSLNRPKLQIAPSCKNTIASIERWSRDPKTGKPKDEYKDPADCVRYLLMADPAIPTDRKWESPPKSYYGVGA